MSRKHIIDSYQMSVIECEHIFNIANAQLEALESKGRPTDYGVFIAESYDIDVRELQVELDIAAHNLKRAKLEALESTGRPTDYGDLSAERCDIDVRELQVKLDRAAHNLKRVKVIMNLHNIGKDASITHVDLKEENVKYDGKILTITA